jgi:hypothetical protein
MDAIGFSFKQVQYKKHFMDLQRFAETISCDWACGYTGVAHSHCTSSGAYKLSGTCQADGCLQPSTTGYKFTMATGSCTPASCDIAKTIQCDATGGYSGTPTVKACEKAGEAYTVSGCKIPTPEEVVKYLENSTSPKKVTSLSCPVVPSVVFTMAVAVLLSALA